MDFKFPNYSQNMIEHLSKTEKKTTVYITNQTLGIIITATAIAIERH